MKTKKHKWFATKESGVYLNGKLSHECFVVTNYNEDYKENGKRVYYTDQQDAIKKAEYLNKNK